MANQVTDPFKEHLRFVTLKVANTGTRKKTHAAFVASEWQFKFTRKIDTGRMNFKPGVLTTKRLCCFSQIVTRNIEWRINRRPQVLKKNTNLG